MSNIIGGRFTGEDLIKYIEESGITVDYKTHDILIGNKAIMQGNNLFVSKEVFLCLKDSDTSKETMRGLSIVSLPLFSPNWRFDNERQANQAS